MAEILQPSSRRRKLAAILHADVVGFSRLMGEGEAELTQSRVAAAPQMTAAIEAD